MTRLYFVRSICEVLMVALKEERMAPYIALIMDALNQDAENWHKMNMDYVRNIRVKCAARHRC